MAFSFEVEGLITPYEITKYAIEGKTPEGETIITELNSKLKYNSDSTYEKLKTFNEALYNLSQDDYIDGKITATGKLSEILEEVKFTPEPTSVADGIILRGLDVTKTTRQTFSFECNKLIYGVNLTKIPYTFAGGDSQSQPIGDFYTLVSLGTNVQNVAISSNIVRIYLYIYNPNTNLRYIRYNLRLNFGLVRGTIPITITKDGE